MPPTKAREKMTCSDCGVELNQHAAKLVASMDAQVTANPDLGPLIQEACSCPQCGKGASRRSR